MPSAVNILLPRRSRYTARRGKLFKKTKKTQEPVGEPILEPTDEPVPSPIPAPPHLAGSATGVSSSPYPLPERSSSPDPRPGRTTSPDLRPGSADRPDPWPWTKRRPDPRRGRRGRWIRREAIEEAVVVDLPPGHLDPPSGASIRRWETSIQPWRRLSSSIRRRDALVALGRGRRRRAQLSRPRARRRPAGRRASHRNCLLHRGLLIATRRRGLLCTAPTGDGAEEQ